MNEVHQHPDGNVVVRTAAGIYNDTLKNFASDYGEALPDLPAGAIERLYRPGVLHMIGDGNNIIAGGAMPWPLGDAIIAACYRLCELQKERTPVVPNYAGKLHPDHMPPEPAADGSYPKQEPK
jgi:hypothetical protein